MDHAKGERFVLIVLAALLFTGAFVLYIIRSGVPSKKIIISQHHTKQEVVLKDIRDILSEKRKININIATISELMSIPGIGNSLASRIVEHRKENGRFFCQDDLLNVKGIGKKKLQEMSRYIVFK